MILWSDVDYFKKVAELIEKKVENPCNTRFTVFPGLFFYLGEMAANILFLAMATAAAVDSASACLSRKGGARLTLRPPISAGRCPEIRPNYTLDRDQGHNSTLL